MSFGLSKILVSIIIPTYNSESNILRCLSSIVNQTFLDFEVIIQDGSSIDDTLELVQQTDHLFAPRKFVLFSEKDSGIYDAMNKAIQGSSGKWILFLGSDDELLDKNVLANAAEYLQQTNADMVYGNTLIVGNSPWAKDGDVYDREFTVEKLLHSNICHQGIFYKRSLFDSIGLYNTRYTICADWDLNLRCFANLSTEYIPQTIAKFYTGGISSGNKSDDFYRDLVFNIKKYFGVRFMNPLFHSLKDAFHLNALIYFKQRRYLHAIRFFCLFFYHKSFQRRPKEKP